MQKQTPVLIREGKGDYLGPPMPPSDMQIEQILAEMRATAPRTDDGLSFGDVLSILFVFTMFAVVIIVQSMITVAVGNWGNRKLRQFIDRMLWRHHA